MLAHSCRFRARSGSGSSEWKRNHVTWEGSLETSGKKSNCDREIPDENGHLKELAVLAAFKTCARVTRACKMDGISPDTFYRWLMEDAAFKKTRPRASRQIGSLEDEVSGGLKRASRSRSP
jgi:hypothetical protein